MTERPKKRIVISALREHAFADAEAEAVARAFLLGEEERLVTSSMLVIHAAIMLIAEDVADACVVEHHGYRYELSERGTLTAGGFRDPPPWLLHLWMEFSQRTSRAREAYRDEPSEMDLLGALHRLGWTYTETTPGMVAFRKGEIPEEQDENGFQSGDVVAEPVLEDVVHAITRLSPEAFWAEDKKRRREAKAP